MFLEIHPVDILMNLYNLLKDVLLHCGALGINMS